MLINKKHYCRNFVTCVQLDLESMFKIRNSASFNPKYMYISKWDLKKNRWSTSQVFCSVFLWEIPFYRLNAERSLKVRKIICIYGVWLHINERRGYFFITNNVVNILIWYFSHYHIVTNDSNYILKCTGHFSIETINLIFNFFCLNWRQKILKILQTLTQDTWSYL